MSTKFCADCHQGFMPQGNNQKRCKNCRPAHDLKMQRLRKQKERASKPKPEKDLVKTHSGKYQLDTGVKLDDGRMALVFKRV